jgi:hypothetical protein
MATLNKNISFLENINKSLTLVKFKLDSRLHYLPDSFVTPMHAEQSHGEELAQ